jgi:hypothetical protein
VGTPLRRLQFGLGTLFVGMTALAIACVFAAVLPIGISQLLIGLIWIVATSVLLIGIFFDRGDQRAFCIGASVVVSSMWTGIGGRFMQGVHYLIESFPLSGDVSQPIMLWLDLVVLAAVAVLNGWLCIRAREFFEKP